MSWKLAASLGDYKRWENGKKFVLIHREGSLWWIDWGIIREQRFPALSSSFKKSKAAAIRVAKEVMKNEFVWAVK